MAAYDEQPTSAEPRVAAAAVPHKQAEGGGGGDGGWSGGLRLAFTGGSQGFKRGFGGVRRGR
eukprot:2665003-Prymnesium_polylepis.1